MRMRRTGAIILMLMLSICVFSQSKIKRLYDRADSILRKRYERITYDTLYINRPEKRLLLRAKGKLSGNTIRYKNIQDDNDSHARISTDVRGTISLGASYMGIAAAFSINPSKLSGSNKDYEFNATISSNRYIIDLNYQRSNTLSGDITTNNETYHLDKDYVQMNMLNITACYIFNHRRFSYPAAFSQSYIQKRSAGSWLAGLSFMGGSIKTSDKAPEEAYDISLKGYNIAIGGGYGYNLVWRKCLFHLSLMPTIIVYNHSKVTMEGKSIKEYTHFPDMIVNSRAAIIYNISPRYYIGSTLIVNSSVFGNFHHFNSQTKWRAQAIFGYRL